MRRKYNASWNGQQLLIGVTTLIHVVEATEVTQFVARDQFVTYTQATCCLREQKRLEAFIVYGGLAAAILYMRMLWYSQRCLVAGRVLF